MTERDKKHDWVEIWSMTGAQLDRDLGEVRGRLVQNLLERANCKVYQAFGSKSGLRYLVQKQQADRVYGIIHGGDQPYALSSLDRVGAALLLGRPEIEQAIGRALLTKRPQAKVLQMPLHLPQREKQAA